MQTHHGEGETSSHPAQEKTFVPALSAVGMLCIRGEG